MLVKIVPKTKRAKERVGQHGSIMLLKKLDVFRSEKAILVESLSNTYGNQKWLGWLTVSEADWFFCNRG